MFDEEHRQKYKELFQTLEPDGHGKVHKSTLKEVLKKGQGGLFKEATANKIIDNMRPDEAGMISVDGLMEAFSLKNSSTEQVALVYAMLRHFPELLGKSNWPGFLNDFGLNVSQDQAEKVISQERKSYIETLERRIEKELSEEDRELLKDTEGVFQSFKMRLLNGEFPDIEEDSDSD